MDEKCVCHINGYRLKDTEARKKATAAGTMANAAMEKANSYDQRITAAETTANKAKTTADGATVTAKSAYTTAEFADTNARTALDAATAALSRKGGTMLGNINMAGNNITNATQIIGNRFGTNLLDLQHKTAAGQAAAMIRQYPTAADVMNIESVPWNGATYDDTAAKDVIVRGVAPGVNETDAVNLGQVMGMVENVNGSGSVQNVNKYRTKGKTVVFFGDSICAGAGDTGGYAKPIQEITGCISNNQGKSGATIANAGTSTYKIVNLVKEFAGDADMIVIEGGTNDCAQGVALGEITATYADELDETTFCGGLESIIQTLLTNYPQARLFGIFTHRDVSDSYTNANGVSKTEFRNKAVAIYEKYAIPYYDAYKDSGFITAYVTSTGTPAFFKAIADMYTHDGDKCHPNEDGYAKYYVPQIIDMLERHCPISDTGGNAGGTPVSVNADMSTVGFVRTAGTISNADTGRRTDYISMNGVQSITVKIGGYDSACAVAFFDSSKAFIADISVQNSQEDGSKYGWIVKNIDVTGSEYASAAYFIISSYHNYVADHVYNGDNTFEHDEASYIKTA